MAKQFRAKEIKQTTSTVEGNPASGFSKIYPKSDNKFYALDSSGNEVEIGGSAGVPDGIRFIPWDGNVSAAIATSYTDTDMIATAAETSNANINLIQGLIVSQTNFVRYTSGTQQTINTNTFAGSGWSVGGMVIQGGYLYVSITNNVSGAIWRVSTSADISSSGNWTNLTISGTALGAFTTSGLVGYGDGDFWYFKAGTGLIRYSLSGTTLTSGSTVTPTGNTNGTGFTIVNDTGIYNYFTSDPRVRFSDFAGTLDGTKQVLASSVVNGAPFCIGYKTGYYIAIQTQSGGYSGLFLNNF